jgi:sporulation protein YlmC with PRC-barrel domain
VKTTASVLTAAFLAVTLASAASAQTRPATDPTPSRSEPQRATWAPDAGMFESSKLIGMKVKNTQNKDVGEISQLIIDQGGKVSHVIVGKGGVLGVGEQRVALAWSDLKVQADPDSRNRWIATVDQAKLDAAPRFEARRDTAPAASPGTSPRSTSPSSTSPGSTSPSSTSPSTTDKK